MSMVNIVQYGNQGFHKTKKYHLDHRYYMNILYIVRHTPI